MKSVVIASAVALGLIGLTASPAAAAKGVKKAKPAATAQHVSGVVTRVQQPVGKGGVGSVTVTATGSKKKGPAAANGGKAAGQVHTFTLTPTTAVVAGHNGQVRAVPHSALAVGEHVTVQANSDGTQKVTIHTPAIKRKRHVRVIAVPHIRRIR